GKACGQGKICCTKRTLDTARGKCANGPAADRTASEGEAEGEVDQPSQPHEAAAIERGVSAPQEKRSIRRGSGHLVRVWRATGRAPARPRGPYPSWQLPSAAGAARSHPERRWEDACARHPGAGGQARPAGGADDTGADLRG